MTLRRQFVHGLKWSALGKALGQVISWVITIVVIRILAPADYGLLAMATVVVALLAHFSDLGLGSALVQAKTIDDRAIGAIFTLLLLLGVALAGLLALAAPLLAWFFDEPRLTWLLAVAGLGFVISGGGAVAEALLRREMNFKALAGADLVNVLVGSLATLAMALHGMGVWALLLGNLIGAAVRMLILNVAVPRRLAPNFHLGACRGYLAFGGYLTASRFAWWFMSQVDLFIAAKLLGKEALGLYSVALNLASLPMEKSLAVINQVSFSAVARIQEQQAAARAGILEGLRWLGYATLPALIGLAATAPDFVPVVLGEGWRGAIVPIQLIALIIPLRMLAAILATAITGFGRADVSFRNTLTGVVIMPACFLVGAQWGAEGLAASWLVAVPLVFALNFPRIAEVTGISAGDLARVYARPALATLVMGAGVLALRAMLNGLLGQPVLLVALIAGGVLIYVPFVLLIDADIRQRLQAGDWPRRVCGGGK